MTQDAPNMLVVVNSDSSNDDGGDGVQHRTFDALAEALSAHLNIPVQTAYLDSSPSVGESIQRGVAAFHPRYVIVLPLFTGASQTKHNNVEMIVEAANERGFDIVAAFYGKPLGMHDGVISAYSQGVTDVLAGNIADTALLVVGRGGRDSATNADAYALARLLSDKTGISTFEVAFAATAKPTLADGIARCVQTGARRIVILPDVLYDGALYAAIQAQVKREQVKNPDIALVMTAPLDAHLGVIQAASQRYHAALAKLKSTLSSDGRYVPRPHSHGTGGSHSHRMPSAENDLGTLLPPRYQGDVTVSAAPMGAADLIYDADGQVAWDQIWGDFCDLALAGGPPHRGALLEPVAPDAVWANPERYQQVWDELARGIGLITGLPVIPAASPGWIGLCCADEAMALWLLRAIVVENISVRREDAVLYFPVGPDFRLEGEIKNIITVIAKTHHYWTEHITSTR